MWKLIVITKTGVKLSIQNIKLISFMEERLEVTSGRVQRIHDSYEYKNIEDIELIKPISN